MNIATIETIHSFKTHPNADSLDLAMVRGFQVVVKKDQFKHGQQIVFIWPDTLCKPAEWNKFLDKDNTGKPIKIKSCKLRGQFSTGLVLPLETLNSYSHQTIGTNGEDVSLILGVEKYVKDDGSVNTKNGEAKGSFPTEYVSKTDETLAQSEPDIIEEFKNAEVYISLKIDGQSLTFIRYHDDIHVCSRNLSIKDSDNKFWNTIRKYELIEKTKGMNIAIQGEQYGVGIQANPLMINDISFAIFNVKDLNTGKYLGLDELVKFCAELNLPLVPIIDRHLFKCFDIYQNIADGLKYKSNKPAEGIVVRTTMPKYSNVLGKMLSVKFINRNYKD